LGCGLVIGSGVCVAADQFIVDGEKDSLGDLK